MRPSVPWGSCQSDFQIHAKVVHTGRILHINRANVVAMVVLRLLFAQSRLPCPCAARSQARAFASGSVGALPSVAAISSVQAPCVDNRARRAISLANRGVVQRSLLRGSCSQQWVEAYTQMSRAVAVVGSAWFARWEGCRGTRIPIVDGASRRVVSRARDFLKSRFLSTQTVSFWADLK